MEILVVLLALSVSVLIIAGISYKIRKYGWLKRYGTQVAATVTRVRKSTITWDDGSESDWSQVTAIWTDSHTNQTYTFWNMSFTDMREKYPVGSAIYIFIDPDNPKRYHMKL